MKKVFLLCSAAVALSLALPLSAVNAAAEQRICHKVCTNQGGEVGNVWLQKKQRQHQNNKDVIINKERFDGDTVNINKDKKQQRFDGGGDADETTTMKRHHHGGGGGDRDRDDRGGGHGHGHNNGGAGGGVDLNIRE